MSLNPLPGSRVIGGPLSGTLLHPSQRDPKNPHRPIEGIRYRRQSSTSSSQTSRPSSIHLDPLLQSTDHIDIEDEETSPLNSDQGESEEQADGPGRLTKSQDRPSNSTSDALLRSSGHSASGAGVDSHTPYSAPLHMTGVTGSVSSEASSSISSSSTSTTHHPSLPIGPPTLTRSSSLSKKGLSGSPADPLSVPIGKADKALLKHLDLYHSKWDAKWGHPKTSSRGSQPGDSAYAIHIGEPSIIPSLDRTESGRSSGSGVGDEERKRDKKKIGKGALTSAEANADRELSSEHEDRGAKEDGKPRESREDGDIEEGVHKNVDDKVVEKGGIDDGSGDEGSGAGEGGGGGGGDKKPGEKKGEDLSKKPADFGMDLAYDTKSGSVKRMMQEMKPEAVYIGFGLFALAMSSLCQLAIPKLMGDYIDRLSVLDPGLSSLNTIIIYLVVLSSINAVFNFAWMILLWIAGDKVVTRLKKQAFMCIMARDVGFFDRHRTGELISRLSGDVHSVNTALTTEMAELVQRFVLVFGGVAYMLYLAWDLTLISMAIAPLLGLLGHKMAIYFHKLAWLANFEAAKANIVAEESVSCLRTVRSFSQEPYMCSQYDAHCDEAYNIAVKQKVAKASQRTFVYYAGALAVCLVLWYGGVKVIDGKMTSGALLTFVLYGMQVGEKSGQLMDNWGQLKTAAGSSQRVFQLIDEGTVAKAETDALRGNIITEEHAKAFASKHEGQAELSPSEVVSPKSPDKVDTDFYAGKVKSNHYLRLPILFEDVHFHYPTRPDKPVLKGLSLTLPPGKVIALVGTSGGGKSTIVGLLERFYQPSSGRVLWGDVDINTLDTEWYHRQVGYVGQEPVLFCTTIRENILYGVKNSKYTDKEYTQEDVERVAKMANAHDFILQWEKGYDTVVGERGSQISGGQKQRIAIARAMLMDPPVLLLDEATSALDTESERVVQLALDRLMVGRTTIMIAHRLSTVRNADLIVVVSGGVVVETGTHDTLLAKGGLYSRLVMAQLVKNAQESEEMESGFEKKVNVNGDLEGEEVKGSNNGHGGDGDDGDGDGDGDDALANIGTNGATGRKIKIAPITSDTTTTTTTTTTTNTKPTSPS